jgi:hypothetical protein
MTNIRVQHRQVFALLVAAAVAAIASVLFLAIVHPSSPGPPAPAAPTPTVASTAELDPPPVIAPCGRRTPC